MLRRAAPTNQWYSNLMYPGKPEPVFAHPLSVRALQQGLEVALPSRVAVETERRDTEIHALHRNPIVVTPTAFTSGTHRLSDHDDWSIEIDWSQGENRMRARVAHGSPYVQFTLSAGGFRVEVPAGASSAPSPVSPNTLLVRVDAKTYAVFAPTGSPWRQTTGSVWQVLPPSGRGYLAVAALPDDRPETLALMGRHAFAFLSSTRVDWAYDSQQSRVTTRFTATTKAMEGDERKPLLGLYPHHWFRNPTVEGRLGPAFDTLRGRIRLLADDTFTTQSTYHGFVPRWPAVPVGSSPAGSQLPALLESDLTNARRMMLEIGKGSYWQGKGLQRILKLADVFEAQSDQRGRDRLLELVRRRMESWFAGNDRKTYFLRDSSIGTVLAYPEEYFSIEQMNDHHFHYGYWIRSAAEIALRDPEWATPQRWGGIVDLLIDDIATTKRGSSDFPFLRNFDAYEGHSWASGNAMGGWGNNQESSSEAVNAWAGLILWGEVQGRKDLRDLGIWLYTTEIEAIQHYWFDIHRLVLPPEYRSAEVSMLFGGKIAHNTWWTDEPRQIKGINLLPITTASTYLGRDPAFIRRSLGTLEEESKVYAARGKVAKPADIWQDIFAKYLALADPDEALKRWDRWGSVEFGDTRSHTLHWLLSLQHLGTPDFQVTADTPLFTVLRRKNGQRTYMAYNAGPQARTVTFSDGTVIQVPPRSLGTREGPVP
jgi:endoglucanase Acf2